jgi:hypothetical protein
VASDPHPANDGAWSELERGFFATAPPDVAEPPPPPIRFDDLDPIAPPPQEWRVRFARVWAATARTRGLLRPVTPVLAAAARLTLRGGRTQAARLSVVLRNISRDRRLVAVAAAALLVVTSISAGVVASRGGSGRKPEGVRAEVASASGPMIREAAPPRPAAPAAVFEEAALPPGSIVPELPESPERPDLQDLPEPMPPPHHRRSKHAKASPRHGAHAKAAGKHPGRSPATPASRR